MISFKRINQFTALSALLLCFSLSAAADEMQDANKLFKQGQHAQALSKVDAILSGKPKDAQARFLKALILSEQGQTDDAVRILSALTEDYPDLPEPYNNLAALYAAQGQYEKAKVALEKALRTHPSYATAHENLGDIYAKMASQAYDRALQLDRSKTSSSTKLAMIKDMRGPASKSSDSKIQLASAPTAPAAAPVAAGAPVISALPAVTPSAPAPTTAEIATPKAVPAQAVVAAPAQNSSNDEVLKALNDWASAWSSKNVKKYLSMYAQDFKTPNNESRNNWEKQRRERISKPQAIVVAVSNARVKVQDNSHATVSFVQSYRSGTLKSTTLKTLLMSKNNGAWQIQSEQTGTK